MPLSAVETTAQAKVDHRMFLRSDDECVQRLASLIELKDNRNLEELISLIGQLSVPISFS